MAGDLSDWVLAKLPVALTKGFCASPDYFILRHLFRFGASLLRIDISPRSLALGQRQQPRVKQGSL